MIGQYLTCRSQSIFIHMKFPDMSDNLSPNEASKPVEPIYPATNFGILQFDVDNEMAIASINIGYNNYPNKEFFPWCAQILFEILDKNENGHPTAEEAEVLNELEDKVEAFLKENHVVHFIGRLTRNGFRDIFYYLDNPDFDQSRTKKFFDGISAIRPVNLYLDEDSEWDKVAEFIK